MTVQPSDSSPLRNQSATTTSSLLLAMLFRPEGTTGVHTHVNEFRAYLSQHGTPPALVTPFSWGRFLRPPVFGARYLLEPWARTPNLLWYRHWHEVFLQNALRSCLEPGRPTVIYAQDPLSAAAALRARQHPNHRVVLAIHFPGSEIDEWVRNGRIKSTSRAVSIVRSQERRTIPNVDALMYVAKSVQHDLLARIPEAARVPSIIIPNFLSLPTPPRDFPFIGDLVTIGRLEPVKNHIFLLKLLAVARSLGTTLTLDIFGDGSQRQHLEEQSRALGIQTQVRFKGFNQNVRSLLPRYRAYVHAAISEPFAYAILEAMAAGLPIIAPRIGGIPEAITEEEGCFWDLNDHVESAHTLVHFLKAHDRCRNAGASAQARFQKQFTTAVVAPRLLDFLLSQLLLPTPTRPVAASS